MQRKLPSGPIWVGTALALGLVSSGCLGAIDGYVLKPAAMGKPVERSEVLARVDPSQVRTIGVVNPFRVTGRSDFVCVGRDGQYMAERLDDALAARVITLDLPSGLGDETLIAELPSLDDDALRRTLNATVAPDAFLLGWVDESDYELVPLHGYASTITYRLRLVDRRGRPLWEGSHRGRGLVYESPATAADALVAALARDLGMPVATTAAATSAR